MSVMAQLPLPRLARPELRYVRAPEPVVFPESALMPETITHLEVRTFLYGLLRFALGPGHSVGSDQFVYWNARDPRQCLAPDAFVKLGVPQTAFGSWKTWERGGPPELAVEILSDSDADAGPWETKLERYRELGVRELACFDASAAEGERLRVWDRVADDLVQRVVTGDRTPCLTLGVDWVVEPLESIPRLRLMGDGGLLVATREEVANAVAREATALAREEGEARARAEARAQEAEDRVRALQAEIDRRR
jgi:Uma2 family endonuclease